MWKCIQSFFGGSSIPQLSPWDHCGRRSQYRAEPAKPFLSYTGWPGLPPGPGAVTDNRSAAHSPFSWEGGHRQGLAEGRLLRFRIPQIPIEVVLKNITKPVQLALHWPPSLYQWCSFAEHLYIRWRLCASALKSGHTEGDKNFTWATARFPEATSSSWLGRVQEQGEGSNTSCCTPSALPPAISGSRASWPKSGILVFARVHELTGLCAQRALGRCQCPLLPPSLC